MIMPCAVSPIFMVEVSTAAMKVSWWSGFMGIDFGLSCMLVGFCSGMAKEVRFRAFS
jgi:hypothetical protein